jgi:hypothetical protein
MWTQVSLNNALRAFLEGRDVRIWEEDTVKSLSEVLSEIPDSVVFLVDKDADAAPAQDIPMDKLVEFVVDGPPDEEQSAEEPEEPEKAKPEPDPPPKASRAKKQLEEAEKNFQKRKIGDIGKLRSLRAAGWPLKKLAEEFGCSEATVYNTMKREGIE